MSTVFYRWGAGGKEESRVTFDGTHISVFDLKREVILNNRMGNGKDFDLGVYDNVTHEEFKDDNHQIPRSSSVIVRRLPASSKGRGNAQNYIIGTGAADALTGDHRIEAHARDAMLAKQAKGMQKTGGMFGSMSKRFDGKDEARQANQPEVVIPRDEGIAAMFAQQEQVWDATQEGMAMQSGRAQQQRRAQTRPTGPPGGGGSGGKFDYSMPPDKEPPVGYICYRCGQKGHWIQDCPKDSDAAPGPVGSDKRFVRVTGIPRSFLKTVETPLSGEGSSGGAMLTADGGFVMSMPDTRQWAKQAAARPKTLTGADVRDQSPTETELTCPICKKLLWDPVKTPCCNTAFCEECITNTLLERAFECPSCESKITSLDKLVVDEDLRARVKAYVDSTIEKSRKEETKAEAEGEVESGEVKAEEGSVPPTAPPGNTPAEPIAQVNQFDPAKMQEMLNPGTMQLYTTQVNRMLQNPQLTDQARALLKTQLQAVNATVMQMQLLAASSMMANGGMMGGAGMNNGGMGMNGMGMNGGMGNGGMSMNGGMGNGGMGMNNGMGNGGMGMGMNGGGMNMGMQNNMGMQGGYGNGMGGGGGGGGGFGFRGRGGYHGRGGSGFRGRGAPFARGGGPARQPMPKRGADEAGFEAMGGEKQARVA
ncbi:DWNN domain-domain-containing protein [Naematelia encephala]|uniref:DWNN domain-domain-containing protein n=1 Tax=Naematelia encephala TaxID=71784 RepID=A0A1Y2AT09_9TREE|nr:DWNN domain-domain-containing protein [Naematelia encephala]